MISAHTSRFLAFTDGQNPGLGVPFVVISSEVTLDESWAPYAQATVTLAPPDDLAYLSALDPLAGARGYITLRESYSNNLLAPDPRVSFFTQLYGRLKVAAITSSIGGGKIAKLTARMIPRQWNNYERPDVVRSFDLGIREYNVDLVTGQIEVKLASDEALLQDYARSTPAGYVSSNVQNIADILLMETIGADTEPTSDTFYPVGDDARFWEVGGYAWDFLLSVVTVARARIWCDEQRVWRLRAMPLDIGWTGTTTFDTATNITSGNATVSRTGEYARGVIVRYHWTDDLGADQTRNDISNLVTWTPGMKTVVIDVDGRYPGPGAANQILRRRLGRGNLVALTALSEYTTTPGMRAYVKRTGRPRLVGTVAAVTWNFPEDEMTVTTRELAEG